MRTRDVLIGLVVVVVWGFNFIAIKLGVQEIPPLLLAALRFVFTVFPIIFIVPRPPLSWKWLIAIALTLNVGQFVFLFWGITVGMPAGLASVVIQSQAFFTLMVAVVWLGEEWRRHHLAGLALAACGMVVIGSQIGGDMNIIGFLMVVGAAISWGVGNVVMRQATRGAPPFSALALIIWAGALSIPPLLILSLVAEGFGQWEAAWHDLTWTGIGSVLYLAYAATFIGYGLWSWLITRYPASVVAPLALLVPVVGLSSTALLLGEAVMLWQGAGAMLVMAGLVVHVFGGRINDNRKKVTQDSP